MTAVLSHCSHSLATRKAEKGDFKVYFHLIFNTEVFSLLCRGAYEVNVYFN